MGRSRPESYRKAHPTGLFTGDPAHAEAATSPGAAVAPLVIHPRVPPRLNCALGYVFVAWTGMVGHALQLGTKTRLQFKVSSIVNGH